MDEPIDETKKGYTKVLLSKVTTVNIKITFPFSKYFH